MGCVVVAGRIKKGATTTVAHIIMFIYITPHPCSNKPRGHQAENTPLLPLSINRLQAAETKKQGKDDDMEIGIFVLSGGGSCTSINFPRLSCTK